MFLFHDQSPITFDDELPSSADVVIIGGGVIGISTAWYLVKRGLSVVVCDKGRIAGEQSSRNWGWVRVTCRDHDEVPIAMDSHRCWREISEELDEDTGFTRQGSFNLAETEEDMVEYEEWVEFAGQCDFDSRLLSQSEIADFIDVDVSKWHGGVVSPSDCRAEPFKAVPAIARGLRARGGIIRENCAVRTIDVEAGRVTGVVTEAGRIRAQSVLCSAGAWSTMFLSNMGISLPQLALRSTVVRTVEAPELFSGQAGLKDIYARRRQDGGYTLAQGGAEHNIGADSFRYLVKFVTTIDAASDVAVCLGSDVTQQSFPRKSWTAEEESPFERHRVLNPAPSPSALKKIRSNIDKRVPGLAGIEFAESWAGMIDATPDVVPVLDGITDYPGLFLATGFSGHGFGIGPGAGCAMADMIAGESPRFDLSRFRFSRFSDGSKLRPGPAI